MSFQTNKVYILGGEQTDFERNWTKEGKSMVALLRESIEDGFTAAGLTFSDVEELNKDNRIACFVGNFIAERYTGQGHLGALLTQVHPAFYGVPSSRYEAACASGSVAIDAATAKIQAGEYDVAIVIGWELMKTVSTPVCADNLGRAAVYEEESKGIDLPFPTLFGRLADHMIEKYGLEVDRFMDVLAEISTINYSNAKRNPLAQTRKWFMEYEQAHCRGTNTNPIVGSRLAVSDCSQITDGAVTVVLASERFMRETGRSAPVVKGMGHRVAPILFSEKMRIAEHTSSILPWTSQAVEDAYRRSGLTVEDIDFFETHDCFTSSEYAAISAFGITPPGKEYEAVESGAIDFNGKKPINPSGGLIGVGHPVGASGVRMLLDLYKQVSGKAGSYQLKKAQNGMMLNIGGSATTNYVFIVGNL